MIHKLAVVETNQIGENVRVDEFAIIRGGVVIGNNVRIHPYVVIEAGVTIGDGTEIFPGCYLGKIPKGAGATARPITYTDEVIIGSECAIGPNAVIFYDVHVGDHTLIADGASLREGVRVGDHCIISRYVTVNYKTTIGNHTKIMDMTHITGNCSIGDNVFISVLVSSTNDNVLVTREYHEDEVRGPRIGDGATIGAAASLLPNIDIREGAFIGTGSVVTKDVAPYDLVMGVPARIIRNIRDEKNK